ncbi:MAG: NAD-dependent deacetylase [Magnetococcales bacterium]|nr:NAD-dependent deacetylase [Magnetococcales bacterium]
MGVDSGLPDFRGKQGFWKAYPAIQKLNLSFEEMANPKWFKQQPRLAWGFYGHRLDLYRRATPHAGFGQLLAMGQDKAQGLFVLTSNVDGQFQAAGFDPERIEECHGSIHHLQCTQPCGETVWSAQAVQIAVKADSLHASGPLPACPACGALARPNILLFHDKYWVENRIKEQEERLWQWLEMLLVMTRRLVIVEVGAGTSVPTIRNRSEFYAKVHHATLIRINPRDYLVSKARHISLPLTAQVAIDAIWQTWDALGGKGCDQSRVAATV